MTTFNLLNQTFAFPNFELPDNCRIIGIENITTPAGDCTDSFTLTYIDMAVAQPTPTQVPGGVVVGGHRPKFPLAD